MKVKIYSLCLFLMLVSSALAPVIRSQTALKNAPDDLPEPFQLVRDNLKLNNYLTLLLNLRANEEKYLVSPMKVSFLEWIIQRENSVGNYDEAYGYEDILNTEFPAMKNIVEQYQRDFNDIKSSPIVDFQMLDAVAAIDAIASRERVIMINEEHRTPFHRALTVRLLAKLYAQGFR